MKSFVQYLTEADYMRFLKKNKRLSKAERKEINNYFTKVNTQAASDILWQSRETREWTYADFENIMLKYKSGFRKKMKVNVPGKRGTDYWQIKLKNKKFLAYIPLTQDMAQYFNSRKFGVCETGHCIGYDDDAAYWDEHVIDEQKVPVYLINGRGKWVVMIKEGNRSYEVWDKMNKRDISKGYPEPILEFSIKKELMNSKLKSLYNDIRDEFYTEDDRQGEGEPDYSDARESYDNFVDDIEKAQKELEDAKEEQDNEMQKILDDTIEKYNEKRDAYQEKRDEYEEDVDKLEKFIDVTKEENMADSVTTKYKYEGRMYTMDELDEMLKTANRIYDAQYEDWNEIDDKTDELEGMSSYEMFENSDDYEWTDDVPDEEGQYQYEQDLNIPELCDYDDYAEYVENMIGSCDDGDLKQAIWSYIYEGGYREDATQAIGNLGYYRP